jgi:ATP-dependent protease HslVU (ClpYQ) peptidase subunit
VTTVVGLAVDGMVFMAADSQVSLCERPMPGAVRKILRLPIDSGGEVLLGIAGDGALAGLARRFLKIATAPGSDEADVVDFVERIAQGMSEVARDHGIVEEGRMAGLLLLGWGGRVWTLVHSQAIPHLDGVAAVGSGGDAALGAVDALRGFGVDPWDAVVRAVTIAIGRDINSAGPVRVEVLDVGVSVGGESDGQRAGVVVRSAATGGGGAGSGDVAADRVAAGEAVVGG